MVDRENRKNGKTESTGRKRETRNAQRNKVEYSRGVEWSRVE
jgi:hypothetical protein